MSFKTGSVLILGLSLIVAPVRARAPAYVPQWGYAQVIELIEKKKSQGHPIQSADEFLSFLPTEVKSHFTFVHHTRGRFQDAHPLAPRVVAYNGRMAFTFNGESHQKGYNVIEFLEFDFQNQIGRAHV